ncbi:hypothetical protein MKEN_00351700 [Mycena kentingensis (nom. inval.)]|nr:hypothetical protein MKEN_00351700 [Mycena kentingensis (nom. inval.)]
MLVPFLKVAMRFYNTYSFNKRGQNPLQHNAEHSETFVSVGNRDNKKILVRTEYPEVLRIIWNELEKKENGEEGGMGSLVVWGQPGIGKSMFLEYALAMAIYHRKFVIYSDNKLDVVVFDPSKEPYAVEVTSVPRLELPEVYLVLSDSTGQLPTPLDAFTRLGNPAFIVQATETRYSSWMKDKDALLYPMEPMPKNEFLSIVRARASDSKSTTEDDRSEFFTPEELYDLLGPMARPALQKIPRVDNPTAADLRLADPATILSDPKLLTRALTATIREGSGFDQYFVIIPDPTRPKPLHPKNPGHRYTIATPFLRKMLVEHLRHLSFEKRVEIAASLSPAVEVAATLFEAHMPIYLSLSSKPVELHFSEAHSDYALRSRLVLSPQVFDTEMRSRPALDTLYTLERSQPSFDAFCVTSSTPNTVRVTILQATIARKHEIDQKGISRLLGALDLQGTVEWRFVFVAPSADIGVAVSRRFWNDGVRASKDVTIPVGWATIPLQKAGDGLAKPYLTATELLNGDNNLNDGSDYEQKMDMGLCSTSL